MLTSLGVKQLLKFLLMMRQKDGRLYLIYSHVRYGVHVELRLSRNLVDDCLSLYLQQISKEAVDLPISNPDAGYTIARTYPPKILLTISPPTDSVGFRVCQLPISGFTKEVKFTLQLNPSLRMVTPLSQLNRHGLLPSITDCETEYLSFSKFV